MKEHDESGTCKMSTGSTTSTELATKTRVNTGRGTHANTMHMQGTDPVTRGWVMTEVLTVPNARWRRHIYPRDSMRLATIRLNEFARNIYQLVIGAWKRQERSTSALVQAGVSADGPRLRGTLPRHAPTPQTGQHQP